MSKNKIGAFALDTSKIDSNIQKELVKTFFRNYDKGLLRTDIQEIEILSLNEKERYNLFYICYMKTISVIPTVEMSSWLNKNFSPDYDICGGAGNLGFCLGIPTSDSHFRLESEFEDRMNTLKEKINNRDILKPNFTLCKNTEKLSGNSVARMKNVNTVIGSWILVQHPDKNVNEALKIIKSAKSTNHINHLTPTKKVKKMIEAIMKKGSVGIPNGLHLKGLLENANLVFIGNFNVHSQTHIKELYSMYKHITYRYEDLPFFIIDKQWLRGNESSGFIKFFPRT